VSAELEVLQDAIARLEGVGIAYMLTGSVALSYYAEPRMTRDVRSAASPSVATTPSASRLRSTRCGMPGR